MQTETATFDTHGFVKRLTSAGMPEPQAEILAEEQSRLIQERLATKQDLERLGIANKQDLEQLRIASKRDVEELKAILEQKLKALEARLTQKLEALEATLEQKLQAQEARLEQKLQAQDIAQKHELEKLKAALKLDLMELQANLEQKLKAQEVTIKEMETKADHQARRVPGHQHHYSGGTLRAPDHFCRLIKPPGLRHPTKNPPLPAC